VIARDERYARVMAARAAFREAAGPHATGRVWEYMLRSLARGLILDGRITPEDITGETRQLRALWDAVEDASAR
jgi:hypothetical protein